MKTYIIAVCAAFLLLGAAGCEEKNKAFDKEAYEESKKGRGFKLLDLNERTDVRVTGSSKGEAALSVTFPIGRRNYRMTKAEKEYERRILKAVERRKRLLGENSKK